MASTMENSERPFFLTTDGHKLACKYWNSDCTSPKALVFIAHGAGEYCLPWDELAKMLVDTGCYVFAHDHVGHGASEGERVQIDDFETYVANVFEHIDMIKSKFDPDMKIFIFGHSMGGIIATQAAIDRPEYFTGVVLSAPALEFGEDRSFLAYGILRICSAILPHLQVSTIDMSLLSRNQEKVKCISEDPLVYQGGLKARWVCAFKNAIDKVRPAVDSIEWPFLVLHGSDDKLSGVKGSVNLYEKAKSQDKTLKIFDGCYHHLPFEPEPHATDFLNSIRDWIVERM